MYQLKRKDQEAMLAAMGKNTYQDDGRQQYRNNTQDIRPRYQQRNNNNQYGNNQYNNNQYNNNHRQQQQGGRSQQRQPPRQGGYMMAQYAPKRLCPDFYDFGPFPQGIQAWREAGLVEELAKAAARGG